MPSVILPFPAPVVRLHIEVRRAVELCQMSPVVENDGRLYLLVDLLEQLPDQVLADVDALVPWTAQATWDLVVRRWPRWAKAAVGAA